MQLKKNIKQEHIMSYVVPKKKNIQKDSNS